MKIDLYVQYVPRAGDFRIIRRFVLYRRIEGEVRILEWVRIRQKRRVHHGRYGTSWLEWYDLEWYDYEFAD